MAVKTALPRARVVSKPMGGDASGVTGATREEEPGRPQRCGRKIHRRRRADRPRHGRRAWGQLQWRSNR
eukprot:1768690-Alexandrium_andersonii.AAC.1